MRRVVKFILVLIIFVPFIVDAKTYNYEEAVGVANSYLKGNSFTTKNRYLIGYNKVEYIMNEDGSLKAGIEFINGGMLSAKEFDLSSSNGTSYLAPGIAFWTLTNDSNDIERKYIIELTKNSLNKNLKSSVKVTEFAKNAATVIGEGTKENPWVFNSKYIVNVKSNNSNYALIFPESGQVVEENANVIFDVTPKAGYKCVNTSEQCKKTCSELSSNKISFNSVNKDVNCIINFEPKTYKITLSGAEPSVIYMKYGVGWFSDAATKNKIDKLTTNPSKKGYTFDGFQMGGNKFIDGSGNIIDADAKSVSSDSTDVTAEIIYDRNNYVCTAGTYLPKNAISCVTCTVNSYCIGGTYTFNETSDNGIVTCPSGYVSDAGSKLQNNCYINVTAGSYLATANTTTLTACPAGKYKTEHKVNYGSTSTCSVCASGTYSTGGATSCTSCPSGYVSDAGATAQNKCYISVAAGKYIATANSSTQTACAKGSYSTGGNVYYGSTSGCSACPNGMTTSEIGSTSSSSCVACASIAGLASWSEQSWSPNSVSNLCKVNACIPGYMLKNETCEKNLTSPTCNCSKTSGTNGVSVVVKCTDNSGSGCVQSVQNYDKVTSDTKYNCKDNNGNSSSCIVKVTKSCQKYNSCQNSACGVKTYGTCTCRYVSNMNSSAGSFSKSCAGYHSCGCSGMYDWYSGSCNPTYYSCPTSACGCNSYIYQ